MRCCVWQCEVRTRRKRKQTAGSESAACGGAPSAQEAGLLEGTSSKEGQQAQAKGVAEPEAAAAGSAREYDDLLAGSTRSWL